MGACLPQEDLEKFTKVTQALRDLIYLNKSEKWISVLRDMLEQQTHKLSDQEFITILNKHKKNSKNYRILLENMAFEVINGYKKNS